MFICSPFRGAEEKNVELARKYARFAYEKGCLPVVPHLYFPQFLKESDVQERMAGIQFGLSLLKECRDEKSRTVLLSYRSNNEKVHITGKLKYES